MPKGQYVRHPKSDTVSGYIRDFFTQSALPWYWYTGNDMQRILIRDYDCDKSVEQVVHLLIALRNSGYLQTESGHGTRGGDGYKATDKLLSLKQDEPK